MHLLLIGIGIGFIGYPILKTLLKKLGERAKGL
jgi:hypothetical protein